MAPRTRQYLLIILLVVVVLALVPVFAGFLSIRRYPVVQRPPVGTVLAMDLSAYASNPYQTDVTPCITAANTRVRPGVAATNILPFGTIVEITSGNLAGSQLIIEDRMNARYTNALDIWFPSTKEAREFGREKGASVVVVEYGQIGQALAVESEEIVTEDPVEEIAAVHTVTLWERMRAVVSGLTLLLRAQISRDTSQYDVDCLSEISPGS